MFLIRYLEKNLSGDYEIFFNPFLDGDRPDVIILKRNCGAFVLEIKDWNLGCYNVSSQNKWKIRHDRSNKKIKSPQDQVFHYKKNLYNLHLSVLGMKLTGNKNFFQLVKCFVYFHESTKEEINSLYFNAEEKLKRDREKNNVFFKEGQINYERYKETNEALAECVKKLSRNKSMAFGYDQKEHLIKKIKQTPDSSIFDEEVYLDFKRRLSPSEHTLNQGFSIRFDSKQLGLAKSKDVNEKVKGVAGCGKTSILAARAVDATVRKMSTVLILTFNITLKNCIRDRLSDILGGRAYDLFEITNYHQFYTSQANSCGLDLPSLIDEYGIEDVYAKNIFTRDSTVKYETILLDEVQDYLPDWVKIIRDVFLSENGEMVLFCDESQDIYHRSPTRAKVITQGFGAWVKLTRSYRVNLSGSLNNLIRKFQESFLNDDPDNCDLNDSSSSYKQDFINYDILKYQVILPVNWQDDLLQIITDQLYRFNINPNDAVILSTKFYPLRVINDLLLRKEKTHAMFETYEDLAAITKQDIDVLKKLNQSELAECCKSFEREINDVRKRKKNFFYANSGLIKLSTIFSYKGLESDTVFFLMSKDDNPEIIYTSISRAKRHLIVCDLGGNNPTSAFFKDHMR